MITFLLALLLMTGGALVTGIIALKPVTAASNRTANTIGPAVATLACLLGVIGLFSGGWTSSESITASWGLPFGSFALG
ncbi:MAG: hypothetical protein IKJ34_03235, partial [Mailhella sp.]|nr:hypothetical protein [Mailhella sp.]